MEFSEFAKKLHEATGKRDTVVPFIKTLFDTMVGEDGKDAFEECEDETLRSYYYGTGISEFAKKIYPYLDTEEFTEYVDGFGPDVTQKIADSFAGEIAGITASNASHKTADLFKQIIIEASKKKRGGMGKGKKEISEDTAYEAEPLTDEREDKNNPKASPQLTINMIGEHSKIISNCETVNICD